MKKVFVLFIILIVSAGFVAAQVSLGADFGITNINKADDEEMEPWADAWIGYDTSFGDLDFHTDLTYDFTFTKEDDKYPQGLNLNLMLAYNLNMGSASTLRLRLDHDAYLTISPPKPDNSNLFEGTFTPLVRFTQRFDFGSIYAQASAPIIYMDEFDKDADLVVNPRYTLGWNSTFGLSLWARVYTSLLPKEGAGYRGLGFDVTYATGPAYIDVFARTYKDSDSGIDITPEFGYNLGAFDFYINCEFAGIAAKEGSIIISPSVGVSFSF
jgi:hypothetical protein